MKRYRLCNPFPSIEKEGSLSYGGNQNWSSSKTIRKCGCGVIAGTDLLLYLDLNKQRCRTKFFEEVQDSNGIIEREQYLKYVHKMRRDYLPLIPHFGMPGWVLVVGLNAYLAKYHTGLTASWGFGRKKLWNRMSAMLSHDIPVILSIVPNPDKNQCTVLLYCRNGVYVLISEIQFLFLFRLPDLLIRIFSGNIVGYHQQLIGIVFLDFHCSII